MTRVRFAPSPTGSLHLGGARTALYNWLYAKQTGGEYLLRIEDTDRERSTDASEQQIHRTLAWLGLDSPQVAMRQSERADRYGECIAQLRDRGFLYQSSQDEANELGHRPLRFRIPESGKITFQDAVRGDMAFDAASIEDPIVVRSDGSPTYNLACAIDDMDMQITDVIRGDDHLSNTPLQVAILTALGADIPRYAHLPMILDSTGSKLSKRSGAASVEDYMDYLPEALLSHLALLGWHPGTEQTIFTLDDLIEQFSLERVGSAPAQHDIDHLRHVNKTMLNALDEDEWKAIYPGEHDPAIAYRLMHTKATTWADAAQLLRPLNEPLVVDEEISFTPEDMQVLAAAREALSVVESWDKESIGGALREMCTRLSRKPRKTIPIVQRAVMGQRFGANLFDVAEIIGKDRALARITNTLNIPRLHDGPDDPPTAPASPDEHSRD